MPDMSPEGIPAAITLLILLVVFVTGLLVLIAWLDYKFAKRWSNNSSQQLDQNYTMTYGLRYIYFHIPLLSMTILLGSGLIVGYILGALMTHLSQYLFVP